MIEQLGPLAYPLLFCSFLTLGMAIERAVFFIRITPLRQKLINQLLSQQPLSNDLPEPIKKELRKTTFGPLINKLLQEKERDKKEREEGCSNELRLIYDKMTAYFFLLKALAAIAPLLGLLGTILGMIDAFEKISQTIAAVTPSLIASGISKALFTTAAGLSIAILALTVHTCFYILASSYIKTLTYQCNQVNQWLNSYSYSK